MDEIISSVRVFINNFPLWKRGMEGDFPDGYLTANPPTPPFFKGGINWDRTYDFVHLVQETVSSFRVFIHNFPLF